MSESESRPDGPLRGRRPACPPGRPRPGPAARPSVGVQSCARSRVARRRGHRAEAPVAPAAPAGPAEGGPGGTVGGRWRAVREAPGAKHRDRSLRHSWLRQRAVAHSDTDKPEHGQRGRAQFLRACCHGKLPRPGGLVDRDSSWRIFCPVHWFLGSPRRLLFSPRTLQRRGAADCCRSAPPTKARKPPNSAYYLRIGL